MIFVRLGRQELQDEKIKKKGSNRICFRNKEQKSKNGLREGINKGKRTNWRQ